MGPQWYTYETGNLEGCLIHLLDALKTNTFRQAINSRLKIGVPSSLDLGLVDVIYSLLIMK
jgi:hypothetical protein